MTVQDGSTYLTVPDEECRRPNGELAFPPGPLLAREAKPGWFGPPPGSLLRSPEEYWPSRFPIPEVRSSQSTIDEVIAHYDAATVRAGLVKSAEPEVGRAGAGFRAADNQHEFGIELYQHKETTFWTLQLIDRTAKWPLRTPTLLLQSRQDDIAVLENPDTGERYTIAASALKPMPRYETREESILWSSLPDWIQFGIGTEATGSAYHSHDDDGVESWNASIHVQIECESPQNTFDDCLDSLDACGFDPSGFHRPEHSYYISTLQWGHSLNVHIRSEAGDHGSLTVQNTLGYFSVFVRYSPASDLRIDCESSISARPASWLN